LLVVLGPGERAQADEAPVELVVLEEDEPQTTYPFNSRTMAEQRLSELLFDRLFINGVGGDIESHVIAPGWRARAPNLTVTMRDGLMFSDGTPVSFGDIAFTINDVYRRQDVGHGLASWYARVFGDAQQITPSVGSVRYLVEMPDAGAERYLLTTPLLSQDAMTVGGRVDIEATRRTPVGTGPFHTATSIENFDDVRLQRNPHRPIPKRLLGKSDREPVRAIRLLYDQDAARQKELMEGSRADLWVTPPPAVLPTFRNQKERYAVRGYDLNQWWYVALNHAHPWLGKPEVRKALDLVIQREQLVAKFGADSARATSGPFLPGSAWTPGDSAPTSFDREAAGGQLRAAGLTQDGSRWLAGSAPVEIRLGVQADLLDDFNDVIYGIINGWEDLGFKVRVRGIRAPDWASKIEAGKGHEDFDAIIGRWNLDREEAALELFRARDGEGPTTNLFGWTDPEVEQILTDFYSETSGPVREALMQKLHRLVSERRPYLFLWTVQVQSVIRRDKVVGFRPAPFYYFTNIDRAAWRVAPAK
jgi:peptide/nickel transport system substrate-binding protein